MKNIFIRSLIISLVFIIVAGSAMAATITAHPVAAGAYTQWSCAGIFNCGPSTHYLAVDEDFSAPNTNDYLHSVGPNNLLETFRFGTVTIPAGRHVDGVLFSYRAKSDTFPSQFKPVYRQNGVDAYGPYYFTTSSEVWGNFTILYLENPVTGQAWTNSEVQSLEGGMTGLGNLAKVKVATVQVDVYYS